MAIQWDKSFSSKHFDRTSKFDIHNVYVTTLKRGQHSRRVVAAVFSNDTLVRDIVGEYKHMHTGFDTKRKRLYFDVDPLGTDRKINHHSNYDKYYITLGYMTDDTPFTPYFGGHELLYDEDEELYYINETKKGDE